MNNLASCARFLLLKQDYESALRDEALYEYGGAAPMSHAILHTSEANSASILARNRFISHYKGCPVCGKDRT